MSLPNEIILRPRFQEDVPVSAEKLLSDFQAAEAPPFRLKRVDDHVFIRFNQEESHFWSPQLQLEIVEETEQASKIYGLFGPNPTLWTFFMFLHFGVATLFVILGVWAYSSAALGKPYGVLVGGMVAMVVIWFVLYASGRAGRARGKPQMNELYRFYRGVLQR